MKTTRIAFAAVALSLAALVTGCATTAGTGPDARVTPSPDTSPVRVAWLTSESIVVVPGDCATQITNLVVGGQTIDVTLSHPDGAESIETTPGAKASPAPCENPNAAIMLGLSAGLNSGAPLTVKVTTPNGTTTHALSALTEGQVIPADRPLAQDQAIAWLDHNTLAVLSFGSSSCAPKGGTFEQTGESATVTLIPADAEICTMDFAPRVTLVDATAASGNPKLTLVSEFEGATPNAITPVSPRP